MFLVLAYLVKVANNVSISVKEHPIPPNIFIEAKGQTFFASVTSMGYEDIMAKQ